MFKIKNPSGDWVTVAEPKIGGIVVTDEPVWSSNAGRTSSGTMDGDIKAWKTTIDVTWPPLTYSQLKAIRDAIGAGNTARSHFDIQYPDIEAGITSGALNMQTKTVYVANIPRSLYSTSNAYKRYSDLTIQFVEW